VSYCIFKDGMRLLSDACAANSAATSAANIDLVAIAHEAVEGGRP